MTETATTAPAGGTLGIDRLYVKEQSAKLPYAPGIFQQEGKPETNLEINIQNYPQSSNQIEVVLTLRATMKIAQQTALILEVQQAGLFRLENFDEKQRAYLLGAYCPGALFPYARKAVADLMSAAGFTAMILPPINFDQLFQQRAQKAESQPSSSSTPADLTSANETLTIH
jgi:preprotein translocase subunit SecB